MNIPPLVELGLDTLTIRGEARELLYRVLGDLRQSLEFAVVGELPGPQLRDDLDHLIALLAVLRSKEAGPLRPVNEILGLPPRP